MDYNYIINHSDSVVIDGKILLTNDQLLQAINFCNDALRSLYESSRQFSIYVFEVLGMRNLSGMVGEYFARSVQLFSEDRLQLNLHQDGYPDLLLTDTPERMEYYKSLYTEKSGRKYPKDKSFFSPYKYGGVEVKATCGSTPPASEMPKPLIGEKRIDKVNQFDWKAHHRETNNLLSIFWDFVDEVPTIVACFYRNDLTEMDWGKIVQPKKEGGRTTSVSIMKAKGVSKMCKGWLAVIDDPIYIDKFSAKKWIGERVNEPKDARNVTNTHDSKPNTSEPKTKTRKKKSKTRER